MRIISLALAAALLIPYAAQATDAHSLLTASRQRLQTADYRVSGHLVKIDARGARTSYGINIKARWFPGVLRVLMEVVSPAEARTHILLEMLPEGKNVVQILHPGDTAAITLPFDKWNEGLLGTAFSYEDLLEAQYFWQGQKELEKTKFGARDCDVVLSTPGPTDETYYSQVKTWLDHTNGFPVYVEKTLRGGTVKEFTSFGLRQNGGVWSANQIEVKLRGKAGSSLLIFDRGTPKANLTLKDFSPSQLAQF